MFLLLFHPPPLAREEKERESKLQWKKFEIKASRSQGAQVESSVELLALSLVHLANNDKQTNARTYKPHDPPILSWPRPRARHLEQPWNAKTKHSVQLGSDQFCSGRLRKLFSNIYFWLCFVFQLNLGGDSLSLRHVGSSRQVVLSFSYLLVWQSLTSGVEWSGAGFGN